MQSYTYGTLPTPEEISTSAGESYPMEFTAGDDFDAFRAAVNQGIDAHLEAVSFEEFRGAYGKAGFRVSPKTLPVLLRRLVEAWEEGSEPAGDLASSILYTLDFEWI